MYPGGYTIEVTCLSPKATENDVHDFFSHCGAIEHLEIMRSGEYARTAYVTFQNAYSLETAVLLSGMDARPFISSPGEAVTVTQEVVKTMLAKGYDLGKGALTRAKALDESYQVSATATANVFELSNRIGLTGKISAGAEAVRSVDERYRVSEMTRSAASFTGRTAVSAASTVVSSSYFSKGALWMSDVLGRASKAAADIGSKGK